MNPTLALYQIATLPAAGAIPPLWLASRLSGRMGDLWPRLGLYRDLAPARPGPRVWLQAVSVGEVAVARQVASALWERRPEVQVTVTTSTGTGLAAARESLGGVARVAPFPLEMPWAVAAAWRKIRPQVYASLETELWPGLTSFLSARGVEMLLLNGRISPRSFPRYQKVRGLTRAVLGRFSRLSMISPADAERAKALGAPAGRVGVGGNAKYAGLASRVEPERAEELGARLALGQIPLLAAGSVRTGEEAPVVEAFARVLARHSEAVLLAAPRHVEKAARWLAACRERGITAQRWTELSHGSPRQEGTRVVVLDAMGVLMPLYGLARAAFLGASLVPLGGQNPLEPAAWGVPACFGPDMADFADAAQALMEKGAARQVPGAGELAAFWQEMLDRPHEAQAMGAAGAEVAQGLSRSADHAAGLILEALHRKGALA